MLPLTVMAPAKINLSLDIVGKRPDGYHLLATVMQSVDLADVVTLSINRQETGSAAIVLTSDHPDIPLDHRNTAHQAAERFLAHRKVRDQHGPGAQIRIHIQKKVPVAAGLAGGSSDAAAVLAGLNILFPDRLEAGDLDEIALLTGADVPFCLHGGTALCEGIGEILTPLLSWTGLPVLLCCLDHELLTRHVFAAFQAEGTPVRPDTPAVLAAVQDKDVPALALCTANVLETVSFGLVPELADIRRQLSMAGALLAQMSGSGPAVFGLFVSWEDCLRAAGQLARIFPPTVRLCPCRGLAGGVQLMET